MYSELLERVRSQFSKDLPFVLYRKPQERIINAIFQKDTTLYQTSDFTQAGFVFAPFLNDLPTLLIPLDEHFQVQDFSDPPHEIDFNVLPNQEAHAKKLYVAMVEKALAEIENKTLKKVVLSRQIEVACSASGLELFSKLIASYDDAFCYLWYHPKVGMWLGATPEILMQLENKRFSTMSLAGTRPCDRNKPNTWGSKERNEQQLVTDYMVAALKDLITDIELSDVHTAKAGNLQHLRTKISGTLQGSQQELVQALHPTPAVCGTPLDQARAFLLNNEHYDRRYYTGFLGELNFTISRARNATKKNQEASIYKVVSKRTSLWVNLRCMQLSDKRATLFVGGGITKDSIPEKEWEETMEKSMTMLKIIEGP